MIIQPIFTYVPVRKKVPCSPPNRLSALSIPAIQKTDGIWAPSKIGMSCQMHTFLQSQVQDTLVQ